MVENSGWVRSMPVSMSPMRAPFPFVTAYEPGLALIARMSHWQAASGSGPVDAETLKRLAHAVVSVVVDGVALARVSDLGSVEPFETRSGATPNDASGATAATAPVARSVVVNDGLDASTLAIPILLTATTRPPAFATAAMPAAEWPCFNTTT